MLDLYLVIIGLFVLIFAILNFFNLLRTGLDKSVRSSWIGMTLMTIFFGAGYFTYIYLVMISNTQGILTLTAWIFFFGAIYVLLTVLTIISTLNKLKTSGQEQTDTLQSQSKTLEQQLTARKEELTSKTKEVETLSKALEERDIKITELNEVINQKEKIPVPELVKQ